MGELNTRLLFFHHEDNWQDIKNATMNTIGKEKGKYPDAEWKRKLIMAEHSPIRKLKFAWRWVDLPYWVSVHFVRHKIGIEHFVKTQRTDRTGVDRTELPQGAPVSHECEADAQGLQRYDAENVGVLYLPEGFEMELVTQEEPFTTYGALFTNGDLHINASRTDAEGYAQAGVSLPADVEEFGSRPGIRSHLPEDAVFDYDEYGNYYVQYVQDGEVIYNALKQGEEAMGNVQASYPEGTEGTEDVPFWLSLAVLF